MTPLDTLSGVGTAGKTSGKKRLDPALVARVAHVLDEIVQSQFGGNQTAAAKALGISQPHLSNLTSEQAKHGYATKGPGLYTLLRMRELSNRTLDDLLGLGALPSQDITSRLSASLEKVEEIQRRLSEIAYKLPEGQPFVLSEPRPKRRRRWNPVGVEKMRQQAQSVRDEQAKAKPRKRKGAA